MQLGKKSIFLLWCAMTLSKIVYLFLGWNSLRGSEPVKDLVFTGQDLVLALLGIVSAFCGVAFHMLIHSSERFYTGKAGVILSRMSGTVYSYGPDPLMGTYLVSCIYSWGLIETSFIMSLVGIMISKNLSVFGAVFILAAIAWLVSFPKPGRLDDIRARIEEARLLQGRSKSPNS